MYFEPILLKTPLRAVFRWFTMALRTSIKRYELLVYVTLRMVAAVYYWFLRAHFIFTLRHMDLFIIWWHRCLILMLTTEWVFFRSVIINIVFLVHSTTWLLLLSSFVITGVWIKWAILIFISFPIHSKLNQNCNVFLYL